jgi:hypothetical protein
MIPWIWESSVLSHSENVAMEEDTQKVVVVLPVTGKAKTHFRHFSVRKVPQEEKGLRKVSRERKSAVFWKESVYTGENVVSHMSAKFVVRVILS